LHEYLEAPKRFSRVIEPGLRIKASIEGSRNLDPQKFQKDAKILEKALKAEKNEYLRGRYRFYLAQSYRDSQDYENALKNYLICSKLGQWDQQVYVSLLESIRCHIKLGSPTDIPSARAIFDDAIALIPGRAEAYHAMSNLYRQHGMNKDGADVAKMGLDCKLQDGLFPEPWIYDYGLLDEFAINSYWSGGYLACLTSCLKILSSEKSPDSARTRVANNAIASLEKLMPRFTSSTSLVFSD